MTQWLVISLDGVLNEGRSGGVLDINDWVALPGSVEALVDFYRAGFRVAVAQNCSAIARGVASPAQIERLHAHIGEQIAKAGGRIEGFFYCPHLAEEQCNCRKPRTGLFEQIEHQFNCSLADSYAVGDSLRDIQCAKAQGMQAVLVRTGKGTQTETTTLLWPKYGDNTWVFDNLKAFADHLIKDSEC